MLNEVQVVGSLNSGSFSMIDAGIMPFCAALSLLIRLSL